jgi:hypothetical protein
MTDPDTGGPKNTDPDPQHCFCHLLFTCLPTTCNAYHGFGTEPRQGTEKLTSVENSCYLFMKPVKRAVPPKLVMWIRVRFLKERWFQVYTTLRYKFGEQIALCEGSKKFPEICRSSIEALKIK